ncbi:type IIA DNA topoisomerase subunit B [Brevibacterium sp. 50QC2O2]|uniref:DNA gyrase/topoisomerase IV subunit B n=1 Tax=unclassified Brevibacterium TaxID=2614124 RepID=UPI00211BA632|nr:MULTISPECIES: DNA topoisomerase IV subunit B [unclassified Brevibacterium]MCQ9367001.1 type IIA DNA topoisomerase subunit B [Brevibacterium sp. 91QC2O2]MCQ9388372.1 type IIA DNA topoisomerase subunit B [Brevibacterium sp. 50QC2O2]
MRGKTVATKAGESYGARQLQVLEGLDAVRKRPGMYIGSTDSRGLMHCLWEIIDNSVDEALAGYGTDIDITLHPDSSVTVADHGRGIPVDVEPKTGLSGVELVMTKLHAGGKFGGGSYAAVGGLHGVGASVVNALSARLDVRVTRGSKVYQLSFKRGHPGRFEDSAGVSPENPFTPFTGVAELAVVGKAKRGVTGTEIRYWADRQIFLADAAFDYTGLIDRARQTAFLVPGLRLRIVDRSGRGVDAEGVPIAERTEDFRFDGGISAFVDYLSHGAALTDVWRLQGESTFTETVPVLGPDGDMVSTDVERDVRVDVALRWSNDYDTRVKSFVNIIATPKGGTHVAGFESALLKTVRKAVEANARKLKVGKDKVEKDDVLAGLTAVVTVALAEPQFEGQTKEVLGTAAVRQIVAKTVERELSALLDSTKGPERKQAGTLLEKVVAEMKARISARTHKENQRRKTALESSSLPAKLYDCRATDVKASELFIVEGDSAMGTARAARNSENQALFPIRGKILNVQKASVADMLGNAECAALIQVVGAGSGRTFELAQARYGKVIIMTDADVDGAHIRTLLLTLFFRYMRPLVEAGRVFAAVPPLHRVEIVNRGKANDVEYTYSEAELHSLIKKLDKRGKSYKTPQRYKGLGEMDADQLAETTMEPQHRLLRRVTMADAEAAEKTFGLLMGSEVAPRKQFIVSGAAVLDAERIDA